MSKRRKVPVNRSIVVRVVGDGLIAGPMRNGVAIPVVIVDSSIHPVVEQAIRSAPFEPDGDVLSGWTTSGKNVVLLHLSFQRPTNGEVMIKFDLPDQGPIVEAIIQAQALYLKAGTATDSFKSTFDRPQLLVDVSSGEFATAWIRMYKTSIMTAFRNRGMGISEARKGAEELYKKMHRLVTFRIPDQALEPDAERVTALPAEEDGALQSPQE